jgi:flagellar hook-associated protein 1
VQALRTGIESQLGTDTSAASTLLSNIASLNTKIQKTPDSASRADLEDQRDQAINGLSSYMDVQTVPQSDGTVSVMTQSGVTLVDRGTAASLSFDGRGALNAGSTYSTDPSKRSVGTVTATLAGGAQIELRDQTLPQAQRQLDDLAAGLSTALTNTSTTGTLTSGATTISVGAMKPGNTLTFPVTDTTGTVRNVTLVASNTSSGTIVPAGQTTDANGLTLTFNASGGPTTYATAIQAAFAAFSANPASSTYKLPTLGVTGGAATSTSATLTLTAGGKVAGAASASVSAVSASDLNTGNPSIALFVDGIGNTLYTGSFDGTSQLTGFAQRLTVNSNVTANPTALTAASATDTSASGTRAQKLFAALTSTQQTFSSSSGIGGVAAPYHATVAGFAQDIIAAQGAASANASSLDDTQQTALSTAQSRFAAGAGVNIDQEMSNLIALQTAYGANARVLTAARDMLNQLLQI